MKVVPIGLIHTPFKHKRDTPIQPFRSNALGQIYLDKKYQAGLDDIEGFSHVILLYKFHKSHGYHLLNKPFLDTQLRGIFATRYPRRPNQIGISVVRLLKRKDNCLIVKGIDVLDGTPLIDIKPFIPAFEAIGKVKIGWYQNKV